MTAGITPATTAAAGAAIVAATGTAVVVAAAVVVAIAVIMATRTSQLLVRRKHALHYTYTSALPISKRFSHHRITALSTESIHHTCL